VDVYDAITGRRSVRKYRPEAVPEDALQRILNAGRLAPSGHNRQPWRFVVVRDGDRRRALADAAASHNRFIAEAPVVLAFLGYLASEGAPAPAAYGFDESAVFNGPGDQAGLHDKKSAEDL